MQVDPPSTPPEPGAIPIQKAPLHAQTFCDECTGVPRQSLKGLRYKCGHCQDFDLCESCFRYTQHPADHVFLVLRVSQDVQGAVLSQVLPLQQSLQPQTLSSSLFAPSHFSPLIQPPQQPPPKQPSFSFMTKDEREQQRRFAPLNDRFHGFDAQPMPTAKPAPFRFGEPFVLPKTQEDGPPKATFSF